MNLNQLWNKGKQLAARRQGFRLFWRHKSQGVPSKPRIAQETIALTKKMSMENRLWGAKRIRDELCKLGIKVGKRTVQKHFRQARRGLPPERTNQHPVSATVGSTSGSVCWTSRRGNE